MSSAGSVWAGFWKCGLLASCCASCSLVSERPPPSAPERRTARVAQHCSDWSYPLADTLSTAAAIAWIVAANNKIDENEAKPGHYEYAYGNPYYYYVEPTKGNADNVNEYKWIRAGGYGALALFAASAVYGWVIEAKCHELKQELADQKNPRPTAAAGPAFPASVLDFSFEFTSAQALRRCAAMNGTWSLNGSEGLCRHPAGSTNPDVQISYELGVPARISLIYPTAPNDLKANCLRLRDSVTRIYGPPHMPGTPFSPACEASLAQCLREGEHPEGPLWHWPTGTIGVIPKLDNENAALELRYLREEPAP